MNGYRGMARSYCRGCGQLRIEAAQDCPHCGEPAVAPERDGDHTEVLRAIAIAIALCVLLPLLAAVPFLGEGELPSASGSWTPFAAIALVAVLSVIGWRDLGQGLRSPGTVRAWLLVPLVAAPLVWANGVAWESVTQGLAWRESVDPALWLLLLSASIVAEEVAFRGLVHRAIRPHASATATIATTTFAFTLARIGWPDLIVAPTLGIALGILRERCGSPYPGMAVRLLGLGGLFLG